MSRKTTEFRRYCELAGINPTRRQYKKWREGKGLARQIQQEDLNKLTEIKKELKTNEG